mmetsp:Transcript_13966/g.13574  ORF Transcript_13966/g.13574 Transcript_13966/m.13574 type:complete len:93 (+) Transcript_13966:347-625(+)
MPATKNIADACVPGPGQYPSISYVGLNAKKFTFGDRFLFNDITHNENKKGYPGPGQYENVLATDKIGKYRVSTYFNSRAANFSKGRRFRICS